MAASLRPPLVRSAGLWLALAISALGGRTAAAVDLSGSWSGQWVSCTSGHQGPLNASFCRVCDDRYRVTFTGRFFKIFPFRYQVTLRVVSDDGDTVQLAGSSYLGRIYGTFTYRATATATSFVSRYDSCRDDGKFILRRCCASP